MPAFLGKNGRHFTICINLQHTAIQVGKENITLLINDNARTGMRGCRKCPETQSGYSQQNDGNVSFHTLLRARRPKIRSATAAGKLSTDRAREKQISRTHRQKKGRRLLAGPSGFRRRNHLFSPCRVSFSAAISSIGPAKNAVPTKKNPTAARIKASLAGEKSVLLRMQQPPTKKNRNDRTAPIRSNVFIQGSQDHLIHFVLQSMCCQARQSLCF